MQEGFLRKNGAPLSDRATMTIRFIRHAVTLKPWGHGLPDGVLPTLRGMSELGG